MGTKRLGRPPKLNSELADRLIGLIRTGMSILRACDAVGISDQTYYNWKEQGELALKNERGKRDNQLYLDFLVATREATVAREDDSLRRIQEAGVGGAVIQRSTITRKNGDVEVIERYTPPSWQADSWYLERVHFIEYGRRDKLDVTSKDQPIKGYVGWTPDGWDRGDGHNGNGDRAKSAEDLEHTVEVA